MVSGCSVCLICKDHDSRYLAEWHLEGKGTGCYGKQKEINSNAEKRNKCQAFQNHATLHVFYVKVLPCKFLTQFGEVAQQQTKRQGVMKNRYWERDYTYFHNMRRPKPQNQCYQWQGRRRERREFASCPVPLPGH